jgi:hypothetical protein
MTTPRGIIEEQVRLAVELGGFLLSKVEAARLLEALRRCALRPIGHGYGKLYHFYLEDVEVRVVELGGRATMSAWRTVPAFYEDVTFGDLRSFLSTAPSRSEETQGRVDDLLDALKEDEGEHERARQYAEDKLGRRGSPVVVDMENVASVAAMLRVKNSARVQQIEARHPQRARGRR